MCDHCALVLMSLLLGMYEIYPVTELQCHFFGTSKWIISIAAMFRWHLHVCLSLCVSILQPFVPVFGLVHFNPSEQGELMKDCSGHRGDCQCWIPAGITEDLRPGLGDLGDQQPLLPSFSSTGAYIHTGSSWKNVPANHYSLSSLFSLFRKNNIQHLDVARIF